jgi:hypothetical protein
MRSASSGGFYSSASRVQTSGVAKLRGHGSLILRRALFRMLRLFAANDAINTRQTDTESFNDLRRLRARRPHADHLGCLAPRIRDPACRAVAAVRFALDNQLLDWSAVE